MTTNDALATLLTAADDPLSDLPTLIHDLLAIINVAQNRLQKINREISQGDTK
jgi:hypothetical protein